MGAPMRQDEKIEEIRLIAKAKEGDMEAFESLVRKYQQSIYYLCRRITGTHQSADDLSQETFIRAYFALSRFKEGMNLYSWLRKIAMNNSLNYLKSAKREVPLDDQKRSVVDEKSSARHSDGPQDKVQRDQAEQKFREAVDSLPVDQKIVFILRFYENQNYREISRTLHLRHGTVMSRLSRARKKLKALLTDYL
jgi:RNA polymerase sigma-70 factor (ECF subfamily)